MHSIFLFIFLISAPYILAQQGLADLYDDNLDAAFPLLENDGEDYGAIADAVTDTESSPWSKRSSSSSSSVSALNDPDRKLSHELSMIIRKILAPKYEEYKRRSSSRAPLYVFKRLFNSNKEPSAVER